MIAPLHIRTECALDGHHAAHRGEQIRLLAWAHHLEQSAQVQQSAGLDLADQLAAALGEAGQHHATVRGVVNTLDDAALLHATDDAGRTRYTDVKQLGHAAHGQGSVRLESGHHLELRDRQAVRVAAPRPVLALACHKRTQLGDDCPHIRRRILRHRRPDAV